MLLDEPCAGLSQRRRTSAAMGIIRSPAQRLELDVDHHHRALTPPSRPGEGAGADRLRPAQRRCSRRAMSLAAIPTPTHGRARGYVRGREVSARRLVFGLTGSCETRRPSCAISAAARSLGEVVVVSVATALANATLMKLLTSYLALHARARSPRRYADPQHATRRHAAATGVTYVLRKSGHGVRRSSCATNHADARQRNDSLRPSRRYFDRFRSWSAA